MILEKKSPILLAVFLFPILIATVSSAGGALYALLLLSGLMLGWSEWHSLGVWEKRVLVGFSLFFILVCLSLVNVQDYATAVKKTGRYLHFPLLIPMYLLLKKYRVETGKVFLLGLLFASIVMFGEAFYEVKVLGWGRAVGSTNSLIFGDISMLVAVIVICALLTVASNWKHHLLGVMAIAMALSASVMSDARGAWLLLPIIIIWFFFIGYKRINNILFFPIAISLIFGFLSFDSVRHGLDQTIQDFQTHIQDIKKIDHVDNQVQRWGSVNSRIEIWRDSITIWKAHSLIGTGIGDFGNDELKLLEEGRSNLNKAFSHAHSIYFDVLATAGLVGLLGLVVLMQIVPFKIFYSFWIKEHDPWLKFYALSGMTTIIAFAVFGLSEGWLARNAFVRTYLMFILVFMSSIAVVKAKENEVISHKS